MKYGIGIFATDETMAPADLGRLAEDRGFESLWLPEHTHIPLNHSPYPWGGDVPRHYKRTLDPFVALAAVATVTTRVRLGFGIALVPQRDPILTAKEVASLDFISGGRVDFGIGAGWNIPEIANHGTDPGTRFRLMRERVEAMKAIWTSDEAEYHGRHVDFGPLWSWPKPVQKPHPPVIVAGLGPKVLDRVLAYGDGWIPNRDRDLAERIAELQRRAAEAGRERIPVTYFGAKPKPEYFAELEAAGVDQAVVMLPPEPPGDVERRADAVAAVVEQLH